MHGTALPLAHDVPLGGAGTFHREVSGHSDKGVQFDVECFDVLQIGTREFNRRELLGRDLPGCFGNSQIVEFLAHSGRSFVSNI